MDTLRDRWGSKLKPRNFPLLAIPGIVVIAILAWLIFQLQSFFNDADAQESNQVQITRTQVAFEGPSSYQVGSDFVDELDGALADQSPQAFSKSNVSCSSLDKSVTSDMSYFTYESRMSSVLAVKNYDQANRFLNNNFEWALDVGYSSRYAEKSEKYLAEVLQGELKNLASTGANWSSLGSQLRPAALEYCDLTEVYDSSLAALQELDGQIARAIDVLIR